jgi:hypothetical protein
MNSSLLLQFAGTAITVLSAVAAVVSVFLAWQAVREARRSSTAASLTELHKLYLSEPVFTAIDAAWEEYRQALAGEGRGEKEAGEGSLISEVSAKRVVDQLDADLERRKSVHAAFWFWEHLAILVNKRLIDGSLVLTGFGSPAILGFLYPVDEAWVQKHGGTEEHRGYLKQLYNLWHGEVVTRPGRSQLPE